jgi:hypothetical protein
MPAYVTRGPCGKEEIDYGVIAAPSPLKALHIVHADGLGPGRVRVDGDRLVFSSPDGAAVVQRRLAGGRAGREWQGKRRRDQYTGAMMLASPRCSGA